MKNFEKLSKDIDLLARLMEGLNHRCFYCKCFKDYHCTNDNPNADCKDGIREWLESEAEEK